MKLLNEIIWSHLSPILLTQEQNYIPTSHCISIYHLWVSRANMNSKNVLPQTIKFLISPHPMSLQYQEKFNSNPQNSLEQEQALKPYYTRVQFNRPFLDAKSPTICFHFFKYSLKIGLGQLCQNQHIPRTRIRAKQRKKKDKHIVLYTFKSNNSRCRKELLFHQDSFFTKWPTTQVKSSTFIRNMQHFIRKL